MVPIWLRELLSRKVSVDSMIEVGMWLAIPYILVGVGWSFVNADYVALLEKQWTAVLPAGSNLLALGITTALWPLLLLAPNVCAA